MTHEDQTANDSLLRECAAIPVDAADGELAAIAIAVHLAEALGCVVPPDLLDHYQAAHVAAPRPLAFPTSPPCLDCETTAGERVSPGHPPWRSAQGRCRRCWRRWKAQPGFFRCSSPHRERDRSSARCGGSRRSVARRRC